MLQEKRPTVTEIPSVVEEEMNLSGICFEFIRSHLIKLSPHENLFERVPKLGLPHQTTSFLVGHLTLDGDYKPCKDCDRSLALMRQNLGIPQKRKLETGHWNGTRERKYSCIRKNNFAGRAPTLT